MRVLLHPFNEEGLQGGFDRVLWSTKDPTNQKWLEAEVLYTFNTNHQASLFTFNFPFVSCSFKYFLSRTNICKNIHFFPVLTWLWIDCFRGSGKGVFRCVPQVPRLCGGWQRGPQNRDGMQRPLHFWRRILRLDQWWGRRLWLVPGKMKFRNKL